MHLAAWILLLCLAVVVSSALQKKERTKAKQAQGTKPRGYASAIKVYVNLFERLWRVSRHSSSDSTSTRQSVNGAKFAWSASDINVLEPA